MKEKIANEIIKAVSEMVGKGYEVTERRIKKNNGIELQAVIINRMGQVISPVIYLEPFEVGIDNEEITVEEAAMEIFKIFIKNEKLELEIGLNDLINKDFILSHVEYQLVNAERNQKRMEEVPHKDLLNLSALYKVIISRDDEGIKSYLVSNEIMQSAGIIFEELDEAASRNTERVGFKVCSMADTMIEMGMLEEVARDYFALVSQMYVITNKRNMFGARALLFKSVFDDLAEKLMDDLYIIPSSIHELMAFAANGVEPAALNAMVRQVNAEEVLGEEILGENVYRYNREEKELSIADDT